MSTATHAQLAAEITSNWPSGNPATLTAASARRYLNDQIDSLNVSASTASAVNLSPYQPFANTASASSAAVLLQIYDGSAAATWGQLNSTTHTIGVIASDPSTFTTTKASTYAITANISNAETGGFAISQALTGTPLGGNGGNIVNITADNRTVTPGALGSGVNVAYIIGGSVMTGNRVGIAINTTLNAASGNTGGQSYGGIAAQGICSVNDGGTGTTFALSKGQVQGANLIGSLTTGATDYFNVTGVEINVQAQTGTSTHQKIGLEIAKLAADAVQGTAIDAALVINDQAGAGVPWADGILFGQPATETGAQWPFASTSTMIGVANPGNANIGVDLAGVTFATAAIRTPGPILLEGTSTGTVTITAGSAGTLLITGSNVTAGGTFQGAITTATTAGGSVIPALTAGSGAIGIYFGSGAPTISAPQGSLYLRSDGVINNRLYINTNSSTTWTAFATTS